MYIAFRIILALVMIVITLFLFPYIVFHKINKKMIRLISNKEFNKANTLIEELDPQSGKFYTVSEYVKIFYYMEYGDLLSVLSMIPRINKKFKGLLRHRHNAYVHEIKALYLLERVDEAKAKQEEYQSFLDMVQDKYHLPKSGMGIHNYYEGKFDLCIEAMEPMLSTVQMNSDRIILSLYLGRAYKAKQNILKALEMFDQAKNYAEGTLYLPLVEKEIEETMDMGGESP
jgi:tetratricopeptide (TPR) repeat protein